MHSPRISLALVATCLVLSPCLSRACTPYIDEAAARASASLRPDASAFERCEVSEASYRRLIGEWLRMRPPEAPELSSLSLGRALAFPWISRHLADAALQTPDWAKHVARARPGERHRLAAKVLNAPALLQRLAAPFEGSRYAVVGISFEKVLFGNASEYSSDQGAGKVLVPFDAQLWLRLEPRRQDP